MSSDNLTEEKLIGLATAEGIKDEALEIMIMENEELSNNNPYSLDGILVDYGWKTDFNNVFIPFDPGYKVYLRISRVPPLNGKYGLRYDYVKEDDKGSWNVMETKSNTKNYFIRPYLITQEKNIKDNTIKGALAKLGDEIGLYSHEGTYIAFFNEIIDLLGRTNKLAILTDESYVFHDYLNELKELANKHASLIRDYKEDCRLKGNPVDYKLINKTIKNLTKEVVENPLIHLAKDETKGNVSLSADFAKELWNIKRVKGLKTLYYLNNSGIYEELTETKLANLIYDYIGQTMPNKHVKSIYNSITGEYTPADNIIKFKNGYLDISKYGKEDTIRLEETDEEPFTIKNIGVREKSNMMHLLDFQDDLTESDILYPKPVEDMTLTEQSIRKILIPKNNPEDDTLFRGVLELIGMCVEGKNPYKMLVMFISRPNAGKSILKLLMKLPFNDNTLEARPEQLTEDYFFMKSIANKQCIVIDEITPKSFNKSKDMLKTLVSPTGELELRGMRTEELYKIEDIALICIYANVILDVDFEDDEAVITRMGVHGLPNIFVGTEEEVKEHDNAYLQDPRLKEQLKEDYEGLSWLISAGIIMNNKRMYEKRKPILYQTFNETIAILTDTEPLTRFLMIHTEILPAEASKEHYVTNDETVDKYLEYLELNDLPKPKDKEETKKKVGGAIKKVYKNKGLVKQARIKDKNDKSVRGYNIKLPTSKDMMREAKVVYKATERDPEDNYKDFAYNSDLKRIYKAITEKDINTLKGLNKKYPNENIYKIVEELVESNYIEADGDSSLI